MENFDTVIVGAGIAGSLLAGELARNGQRVLILEAGPEEPDRQQLLQRYYADPSKHSDSPYPDAPQAPQPAAGSPDHYFVQTGRDKFRSTYLRRAGGTTWHWQGLTPRLQPTDFRMKTEFGVGVDWPISYGDLEPWYAIAETTLGVSGSDEVNDGSPRSAPFPYPALAQSRLDYVIAEAVRGTEFRGVPLLVVPQPSARNPDICQGSGSCTPICPTGAKYEAMSHLVSARESGATLRSRSVVSKIITSESGAIDHIVYRNWDGREHQVAGKTFVLAAHGIETPKLLLMSGVANSSDQVGRNLMDHPAQVSVAIARDDIHAYQGPQTTSAIMSFRDGPFRSHEGGFKTDIFNSGFGYYGGPDDAVEALIFRDNLIGEDLRAAVAARARREFILLGQTEQLPNPDNRVGLSGEIDALGLPRPAIHFSNDDYSKSAIASVRALHDFVFERVGVSFSFHVPEVYGSDHIMGTTRMGSDPGSSVVDADLRCHDHPNLYIVGSGAFPTGGTANPTLTIAALSLRLANHLLAS